MPRQQGSEAMNERLQIRMPAKIVQHDGSLGIAGLFRFGQ